MGLLWSEDHALTILKDDHDAVKQLFDDFEESVEKRQRNDIARRAIEALKVHAAVEEELFYPALRKTGADGVMDEADEEHHVAKLLIAELELMKGDEANYAAKFIVLAESVRHHIKEEERNIFAQAKKSEIDLEALGKRMRGRKRSLEAAGVPEDVEEAMIRKAGLPDESPARRAAHTFQLPS
jgi:hemerythrin-like domain-containing protein